MFKYIICVGSSLFNWLKGRGFLSLNTSYVSVQVIARVGSGRCLLFKYIICVGSRLINTKIDEILASLNTSYVSVQEWFYLV